MKTVKPEAKRQAEKASSTSPKILMLQREVHAIKELSLPYIKLMMETNTLTIENFEMLQLQLAAENGFTLVMEVFLTGEADVNRADGLGRTALDFATKAEKDKMVMLLKEHGAVSGQVKAPEEPEEPEGPEEIEEIEGLLAIESDDDEGLNQDLALLVGEGVVLE